MAGRGRSTREIFTREFLTAPADANIIVFPFAGYIEDIRYVYNTAASVATTAAFRKITDATSAPGATAGATVVELTGADGTGTENMQATANVPRQVTLIETPTATAKRRRTFKAGDRLAVNFSSAATALEGLVVVVMVRVFQYGGN